MRPLRLQLKGFTAFRDEQELDFTDLDLFAIAGPTGSGKSSLLDAITYALFGTVERVGKQVGQLVSQGQPSMAVTLAFEVDGERWQVARRTKAGGTTMVLLERWDGADWGQAGEGSDKVREVNARITSILGLDYDAFTRSVLLPQGQFAEFLVGDAKERRDILKELLGLELFDRLAKRAGAIRNLSRDTAAAREDLLAKEYEGVGQEAIDEALARSKAAAEAEAHLAAAETTVRELRERSADAEREAAELAGLTAELVSVRDVADDVAARLADVQTRSADADTVLAEAGKAALAAGKAAAAATKAREKAEAASGGLAELGKLLGVAQRLDEQRAVAAGAAKQVDAAMAAIAKLEAGVDDREASLARARTAAEEAAAAVESAREAHVAAMHQDVVATVRSEATVGEPCPVCGEVIAKLPARRAAGSAAGKAEKAVVAAGKKAQAAEKTAAVRQRERDEDAGSLDRMRHDLAGLEKAIAGDAASAESERAAVIAVTGKSADPTADLSARIESLELLVEAERIAVDQAAGAERAHADAERERERAAAESSELRARLDGLPLASIGARIAGAGIPMPQAFAGPRDEALEPAALAKAGISISAAAATIEEHLAARVATVRAGSAEVLASAKEDLVSVVPTVREASSLADLEEIVAAERRSHHAAAATAAADAERLRERLERSIELAKEVEEVRARAVRFEALAKELRADRVIAFLQQEALQLLAIAASRHLATLSSDRYRLLFQEEEFYVIDTWNGEEARRARTLSGGETFLASLALALALSEEVRSLSLTDRAKMDSLFLDEGFGSLDPDTLETVVDAIEQLGGDGRMVGVITHVHELAVRLPARVEVEKSPRGSRFSVRV